MEHYDTTLPINLISHRGPGKWEMPIREEPGNREKTPYRAVGSLGHLGYLTELSLQSAVSTGTGSMVPPEFDGSEAFYEPRLKFLSGRFDINLVASLWVGKERALKPSLQLFITLDRRFVCLFVCLFVFFFPVAVTPVSKKKTICLAKTEFLLTGGEDLLFSGN